METLVYSNSCCLRTGKLRIPVDPEAIRNPIQENVFIIFIELWHIVRRVRFSVISFFSRSLEVTVNRFVTSRQSMSKDIQCASQNIGAITLQTDCGIFLSVYGSASAVCLNDGRLDPRTMFHLLSHENSGL